MEHVFAIAHATRCDMCNIINMFTSLKALMNCSWH